MKSITSAQNKEIKDIAKLIHPSERKRQQRFIVEGIRSISTFVQAEHSPLQIYALESKLPEAQRLTTPDRITIVNESVLNRISPSSTPSGILAIFKIPQPSRINYEPGLVLARIADPGNMGTLIRTCAALGKKSIVVIEGVDVWSPKVIQASAGTIALVSVISCTWQELVQQKGGLRLIGLTVSGGKNPETMSLTNALLVVGSEAHGIPEEWLADCDELVTIPMPGQTESLNAAVAGSIALYLAWKS